MVEPYFPCSLKKYSNGTKMGWGGEPQPTEEEEMKEMFISPVNSEYQIAGKFRCQEGCILQLEKPYSSNH
jgi:hypothetical protein